MTLTRRTLVLAAAALCALPALAQDRYPTKPITIVVPYPPGGSNDVFARMVGKALGDALKTTVVIDNRPGASGNTGTAQVAKATPDGYTLVAVSSSMTTNAAINPKMPFDPVKSFAPVAMFAKGPFIVAVNNELPVRTPAELVATLRTNPGRWNYASSGIGSSNQFATEMLKAATGSFVVHVPYRGMAPAVTGLIGGETQLLIASGPSLLPQVRNGRVRALGITSLQPSAIAPELPPMASVVPGAGPQSAYIAGPYACTLLADQGAEVLKVEPPEGDNLRTYPSTLAGESRAFVGVNRGKRGLALDLKQAAGLALLLAWCATPTCWCTTSAPGCRGAWASRSSSCRALNPRLIHCALTGYGDSGPLKDKAGYDQVLQTLTGMCSLQGKPGQAPEILYGSVVDYYAAALLAGAVSSALYERERSGQGQQVGVSLLRSALAMQSARLVWADGEPRAVGRDMRSGGITGIHPTREGHLYISANTPHFWRALCHKVGLPALAEAERYDSVRKRALHKDEIVPLLHQALQQRTALEWEALFGDEVPCAAAREVEDMFDHPQVQHEQMIASFSHPVLGSYRGFTRSVCFGRTPGPDAFAAPTLGQHTQALRDALNDG
jgi:crotonobetainyl-CoA:carnitine CoA-transferase CaiB-like acyl-CoA transferase/tripartite-type tricarboxylate transporter receptor subunit TctC